MSADQTKRWKVKLFGGLSAESPERRIDAFQTQKTAQLFAYLALNSGRFMYREVIADLFWPQSDRVAARASLNQAIAWIRKEFGERDLLTTDRNCVAIERDLVDVDVERFLTLVLDESGSPGDRRARLVEAEGLYSDELLKGMNDTWVRVERLVLAEKYVRALKELTTMDEQNNDLDESIEWQRKLVRLEPHVEEHHIRLMKLYGLTGNTGGIRRHMAEYAEMAKQSGLAPSREMLAVVEDLTHESIPTMAVTHAEASSNHNVPSPISRFYGREDSLDAIRGLLSDRSRLITILGLPGVGKTRLAIQVGLDAAPRFAEVCYVQLAPHDPDENLAEVIQTEIEPGPAQSLVQRLSYASSTLLILDNFEHFVETGVEVVRQILNQCPNVQVLTTSQVSLGLNGEVVHALAPLPVPPNTADLRELLGNPSFQMLLDRIRSIVPNYQPTEGEAEMLAVLCRRLEGFPLAIEIAAARTQTSSVYDLLQEVSERLETLSGHASDVPSRHQSIHAALNHCFAMLSEPTKRALSRLSVFRGGWTLDAAEDVLREDGLPAILRSLMARALIWSTQPAAQTQPTRFEMLDLVRRFSMEQSVVGDIESLGERHAEYYARLAKQAAHDAQGPKRAVASLRLRSETPNLIAALEWLEAHERFDEALDLAVDLGWFWQTHGVFDRHRDRLQSLVAAAEGRVQPEKLASAYQLLGQVELLRTALEAAETGFSKSLDLGRTVGDQRRIASSLLGLGAVSIRRNQQLPAKDFLEESLAISDASGDTTGSSLAHLYLAFALSELEEYEDAKRHFDESLRIETELQNYDGIAKAYSNLSIWARFQGRLALAAHYARESLRIYDGFGQWAGVARASTNLAKILSLEGEDVEPLELICRALTIFDEMGDILGVQSCIAGLVSVFLSDGRIDDAARMMAMEATLAKRLGAPMSPSDEEEYRRTCQVVRDQVAGDQIEALMTDASIRTAHEIAQIGIAATRSVVLQ
ncbi:MAG: tetratricopeptide repeat protein [Armatimonadetes bacterium]|nr:tetratricopeptide repeat protein [Armatimonadota bacterium]